MKTFLVRLREADSLEVDIWPRKPGVYRLRIKLPGTIENDYEDDIILTSPDDLTKEEALAMYELVLGHDWSESMRLHEKDK